MPRAAEPPRLYLRKDDRTWIIRDRNRDRRTGCAESDRAGAEKRLAEYLAEKHASRPARGGKSDTVPIAEVLRVYAMEHAPSVADPALVARFIEYLIPYWGHRKVSEIKGATCRKFTDQKTPAIARRSLETLRAAVNYFHKEYGLDPVPAFTMPTKAEARERWLTRQEAAALIRATKTMPHLRRFVLIGLYTGTRSGAMLNLSWLPSVSSGWIDLERAILYRSGTAQRRTKKQQTPARIPPRLLAHMKRWRRMDGNIRHVIHWNGSSVKCVKKAFRSARKNASLSDDVIPHSLRHTFCTWVAMQGVPVWEAAGYAGMTVETFEKVYGHHHPDFQKSVVDSFSNPSRIA
jgi:integrase